MLLPVGGVTNNGIPHPASGALEESPLSASIVKVALSKPGFDGRIRYSSSDAATARVTGGDVTRAAGYTPSLGDFEPSSNGVAEMRVNLYRGALKGHLFFSRFATGGDGLLTASNVTPNGKLAAGGSAIRTVKYFSGLSITVSPYGALVMPRVRQGHAAVLIPIYKRTPDAGPLILSV
eukprot:contig_28392_g6975